MSIEKRHRAVVVMGQGNVLTRDEEIIRQHHATRVLNSGIRIWERFKESRFGQIRRGALREKARALITFDRILTGIDPAKLRSCIGNGDK